VCGRKHVAQKPLSVMRELVRIVVPGGLVLDPFAGAGTTGLAALAEGRRFLGFELHAGYAAIARRRWHANRVPRGRQGSDKEPRFLR
jgi:site-specific DNA-methyltransferase (adenine-specific)